MTAVKGLVFIEVGWVEFEHTNQPCPMQISEERERVY